jgi:hypothetical protein
MDNLKKYLRTLGKHHFWVLCGLVLIISLATWSSALSSLDMKFEQDRRSIASTYASLGEFHAGSPNATFAEKLDAERTKIDAMVLDAWKLFGKDQHERLKWPESVDEINKLSPREEISEALRENYVFNTLKVEWERIFKKANLRHPKGGQQPAGGGFGGFGENRGPIEYEGIVEWSDTKRAALKARHEIKERPSTIWVRTTQENLWVYESIVDLVAKMNNDFNATDQLNAVIKRIDSIELAQWATSDAQHHPGADLELKKAEDPMAGGASLSAEDMYVRTPDMPQSDDKEKKLTPDMALLDGRYLDESNRPVSAEAALKDPPFTEFKQLFISMQFLMDQRRISELLAACANSHIPIEARQVIMHFQDTDYVPPKNEAGGVGVGGAGGGGGAAVAFDQGGGGNSRDRAPYDAIVEIRGIVYIYNDPEPDKLGKGSAKNPAQRSLGIPLPNKAEEQPAPAPDQNL